MFIKNLKQSTHARTMADLPTSLPPCLVGLIVFSGIDAMLKGVVLDTAFDIALSKEQNHEMWRKVGATSLKPKYVCKTTTQST